MNTKQHAKYVLTLLLSLHLATLLFAQSRISGKVTDQKTGSPLAGVSVQNKSTMSTTVTDAGGGFSIAANDSAVIEFSYVGYDTQERKAGPGATLIIAMVLAADKQLDDVVVIGYGTVRRRDLTGAVGTVKSADIVRTPTFSPVEAIQGRVAGADITRNSGRAGGGTSIQIRGTRSVGGLGTPLYVIDGVQFGNIDDLNPNDIESIDVLRDASSTAIYGSAGANGVVIVTTKKGKDGKPRVNYNGYYGINGLTKFPKGRTGEDYLKLRREAFRTAGSWNSPADDNIAFSGQEMAAIQAGQWVDWIDELMRNGIQQSHTLSVSGGNDKIKTFLSGGYFNETGRLVNDVFRRYTVRFNVDYKISDWIKTGIQSQLTIYDGDRRPDQLAKATGLTPLGVPYDANGNINLRPIQGDPNRINPLADNRGKQVYTDNTKSTNLLINPYVEITPFKGLSFRSNFGFNNVNSRRGNYRDSTSFYHLDRSEKFSDITLNNTQSRILTWDNILTWNKQYGGHSLTVTGIASMVRRVGETYITTAQGGTLAGWQGFYNIGAADPATVISVSDYTRVDSRAYAGRINYGYKGKYLLTLTYRSDGDSRLGDDNKWSSFPSVAAAWNIRSEQFMQNVLPVMNVIKLRAGWGISGSSGTTRQTSDGTTIEPYPTQSVIIRNNGMVFGTTGAPYFLFSPLLGNPNLGWERTATTNLGLDLAFLKNRISATIDVYRARTYDMLIRRRLPVYTGVGTANNPAQIYENIGETVNKGIEITVNSQNIVKKDFQWNSTLTFTSNKEKITSLPNNKNLIPSTDAEIGSLLIGRPISSFYSYQKTGIWQTKDAAEAATYTTGGRPFKPGDIKFADLDGNHRINDSDRTYLGSSVPKFILGFQNNFTYKNFDLGVYVFMRWGQTINAEFMGRFNPDGAGNGPAFMDYWTPENPSNDFPRPINGPLNTYFGYQALPFIDGSFIKIKNISLGYTLPKTTLSKMKLASIRFYATASNVFTFSKNHLLRYYDPERGGGTDDPLNRQLVLGVNVGF